MKNKQILIAVLVFLGLIAIYFATRHGAEKSSVTVGYQPISNDFSPTNVTKIELYKGEDKKNAVVLTKGDHGWEVESSFQVSGDNDKIQNLLNVLVDTEGKVRATGKEFFGDFYLTDTKALHVIFTGKDTLPHMLIGKSGEDNMSSFIRLANKDTILLIDKDIRTEIGIGNDANLKSEDWIDKQFLKLDKERIQQIAYHLNGKDFLFKKQEKKADKQGDGGGNKETEKKEKEYEWKLVSWDKVFEVKDSKIQDILEAAASLWIEKAVDPVIYNNDFFKHTNTRITISTADNKTHTIHLANRDQDSYVKKEGSPSVYKITSYEKKRISPDAGEFLKIDLPKIKEFEGYEVLDYRVDENWPKKQKTHKELKDGDTIVKVTYSLEDEKTWICFDDSSTVFAFNKELHEKLSKEKEEEKT